MTGMHKRLVLALHGCYLEHFASLHTLHRVTCVYICAGYEGIIMVDGFFRAAQLVRFQRHV
jgi:hypothetical protein